LAAGSLSILILDDDEIDAPLLERTLGEQGGFALCHAPTRSEGIAAAQREEPDLVLLDLGLPDGQGLGNVELVRQHTPAPIIVLSPSKTSKPWSKARRSVPRATS
tara:strand:+ start:58063 stop:58377 length:315 start_codon:yes stop_codon:yes gene_type:complete